MAIIDQLSLCPVRLHIKSEGGAKLADATGFLVDSDQGPMLLTARHCVTGRHHDTGKLLDTKHSGIPASILVLHHVLGPPNVGIWSEIKLYDDRGLPQWIEHPEFGCLLDIAALPVNPPEHDDTQHVRLDELAIFRRKQATPIEDKSFLLLPAQTVSVIGYPFGRSTGSTLPIWATGFIASEPNVEDVFGKMFIDCRARPGQSGAPVFAKRFGELIVDSGEHYSFEGEAHCFLGMYVGRISAESDIGIVYRTKVLDTLARAGVRGHDCSLAKTNRCRCEQ